MRKEIKDSRNQRIGYYEERLGGNVDVFNKVGIKIGSVRKEGNSFAAYDSMLRKIAVFNATRKTTETYPMNKKIADGNVLVEYILQMFG